MNDHPSLRAAVIGGSTIDTLTQVVGELPVQCGFAVLLGHDQPGLASALRATSKLPIVDAETNQRIEHGRVYLLPANMDVLLQHGTFIIAPPSVPGVQLDRLLRSVADDIGRNATALILDGVGTDGVLGIKRIKEAGGVVMVGPMREGALGERPRATLATGLADAVHGLEALGSQLFRIATEPHEALEDDAAKRDIEAVASDTLRDILALVRIRSGHDFSQYKRATLYRRVARRMQVCQAATMADYHLFVRQHPSELAHLLRDFLISVTNFFRDPDAYDALAKQVIPKLFADRTSTDQVRVWIAGCATGEEAYSLGMLLLEYRDTLIDRPQIQLFATDIDENALAEARHARYAETIAVDVSPERLARFFVREGGQYRVTQELRELVLFSPHNLLRDPPFSRLDLVSCRNLLIYLNREAQERVLAMFHFGLHRLAERYAPPSILVDPGCAPRSAEHRSW